VKRALIRYAIALSFFVLPVVATLTLERRPSLGPLVSLSFLIAVAGAGWVAGVTAGILAALFTIPLLTVIATHGAAILPPHYNLPATAALLLVGIMGGGVARARKRVEDVLRRANAELEEKVRIRTAELDSARTWLQITLASIGDAVIATDPDGRVRFLNGVAQELTGWSEAEANGRPISEVFAIVNEQTRQAVADPVAKVLASGAVTGLANHTILMARNGREIPIDDSAAPIRDSGGEIVGVVLTFRDIAERRKTERLAEESRERLELTNRELQQFAFAASHDLREPLRNISIYSQLLAHRYGSKLDADAGEFISIVITATRRMEMLLGDLLAYTTVSTSDGRQVSLIDANRALSNVVQSLKGSLEESGARITYDGLPTVPIDEVHLEQLFQNLISNGVKYRADRAPSIHVAAEQRGAEFVFCVSDNGIGIAPQYQERIFGLFKRLHSSEEYEGTGMGLAICQKIVQRYGGRIWVESEPERGSQFYFTIPSQSQ
jgi:PAS domain S-box-containing protein